MLLLQGMEMHPARHAARISQQRSHSLLPLGVRMYQSAGNHSPRAPGTHPVVKGPRDTVPPAFLVQGGLSAPGTASSNAAALDLQFLGERYRSPAGLQLGHLPAPQRDELQLELKGDLPRGLHQAEVQLTRDRHVIVICGRARGEHEPVVRGNEPECGPCAGGLPFLQRYAVVERQLQRIQPPGGLDLSPECTGALRANVAVYKGLHSRHGAPVLFSVGGPGDPCDLLVHLNLDPLLLAEVGFGTPAWERVLSS
mmetsp:Transcript_16558/g.46741  ORF Transcript_16558/g.46741 Transcript_16558/m.46741 type:complete len:254 (-) Transcript_16558:677-1438(-)